MDDAQTTRLRELLERLGRAIYASVADSNEVGSCLAELRGEGWDAMVILEGALLSRQDEDVDPMHGALRIHVGTTDRKAEYRLASEDARWLTSIGISPTKHRSHPQRPLPPLDQPFPPAYDEG